MSNDIKWGGKASHGEENTASVFTENHKSVSSALISAVGLSFRAQVQCGNDSLTDKYMYYELKELFVY